MTSLILSDRFYQYIKFTSITNIYTALVELLTNSIDAYKKIPRTERDEFNKIYILVNAKLRKLIVIDNACGMYKADLVKCFGQVGNYTSTEESRGFFSKGAKDISAIGNMKIVSIKDNLISSCELHTNNTFIINDPEKKITASQSDRQKYSIPDGKNGVYIEVSLNDSFKIPNYDDIIKIKDYYSVRDIFSDTSNSISFDYTRLDGTKIPPLVLRNKFNDKLDDLIFNESFKVPGYEHIHATFKVYKKKSEYCKVEDYSSFMYHGVLIKDDSAIYDINTFYNDIRNHPKIYNIYCFLETDGINKMMYSFDKGEIDNSNPFPVLNPSRMGTLNKDHPFVKNLYSRPHKILKFILDDLYSSNLDDSEEFDISEIFKDMDLFDDHFYESIQKLLFPSKIKSMERLIKYIKKTQINIIPSDNDQKTVYTSDDMLAEFENSKDGEYEKIIPSFSIKFIYNEEDHNPCVIFTSDGSVKVVVNVFNDILSKFSEYRDKKINIIDKEKFSLVLTGVISDAFTFQMMKTNELNKNTGEKIGIDEVEIDFIKYKNIFMKQFYKYFINNDILNIK